MNTASENKIPLSPAELDTLRNQMELIVSNRKDLSYNFAVDTYIEKWRRAKYPIYKKFGGTLIKEVPIGSSVKEVGNGILKTRHIMKSLVKAYPATPWVRSDGTFAEGDSLLVFLKQNISFSEVQRLQAKGTTFDEKYIHNSELSLILRMMSMIVSAEVRNDPKKVEPHLNFLIGLSALKYDPMGLDKPILSSTTWTAKREIEELNRSLGNKNEPKLPRVEQRKNLSEMIEKGKIIVSEWIGLGVGAKRVSPKLTKQLSKLRLPFESELFDNFIQSTILLISQLNNEINVHDATNLKLSIHPLDYLTQSENDYGWRSCTALDGEYSSAVFSEMTDSSTMVAYAESTKSNLKFSTFRDEDVFWNNKKWRMLAHWDTKFETIGLNKHYPMEDLEVEKLFLDFFNKEWGLIPLVEQKADSDGRTILIDSDVDHNDFFYLDSIKTMVGIPEALEEARKQEFGDRMYINFKIGIDLYCIACGNLIYEEETGEDIGSYCLCSSCGVRSGVYAEPEEEDESYDYNSED